MLRRCHHLLGLALSLYAFFWGGVQEAYCQSPFLSKLEADGQIRLYSYHLNEFVDVRYRDPKGLWDDSAYQKIRHLCRSRAEDESFDIDRRLIELADHLQDHFGADTVEVISCYRSPAFNRNLKENGHNVANESFHTKGLAMDIHLDETKESTLRDYLQDLQLGGVGYYGNRLMVHMDFGPVRQWEDGDFKNNTAIGVVNKDNPWRLTTDKLFYSGSEDVLITITGADEGQFPAVGVEKFFRGQWIKSGQVVLHRQHPQRPFPLVMRGDQISSLGKFRLHFERLGQWQNSNEFYRKKN